MTKTVLKYSEWGGDWDSYKAYLKRHKALDSKFEKDHEGNLKTDVKKEQPDLNLWSGG